MQRGRKLVRGIASVSLSAFVLALCACSGQLLGGDTSGGGRGNFSKWASGSGSGGGPLGAGGAGTAGSGGTAASGGPMLGAGGSSAGSAPVDASASVYDAPDGVAPSEHYSVTVIAGGVRRESFVYQTSAPDKTYPEDDGGDEFRNPRRSFSWSTFSFSGEVVVEVKLKNKSFKSVVIRPKRNGIAPEVLDDHTIQFRVSEPGAKLSIEFDHDTTNALLLFADPPEATATIVEPEGQSVYRATPGQALSIGGAMSVYFGPGLYDIGYWQVPAQVERIYLAGGAYVYGALDVPGRGSFTLSGRGVLSGGKFVWRAKKGTLEHMGSECWSDCLRLVELHDVPAALIDGVTLVEAPYYSLTPRGSTELDMRNFKILGAWRWNTDGPDIPQGGTVEDCFVQANDDMFKVYHSDVTVQRCVAWQMHNGAVVQMGWNVKSFENVSIHDLDVIHAEWIWSANTNNGLINFQFDPNLIAASGNGTIRQLSFENIRMEGQVLRAVGLYPPAGQSIEQVVVRNLHVDSFGGDLSGAGIHNVLRGSDGGRIDGMSFESMSVGDTLIGQDNAVSTAAFDIDAESTSNISFAP